MHIKSISITLGDSNWPKFLPNILTDFTTFSDRIAAMARKHKPATYLLAYVITLSFPVLSLAKASSQSKSWQKYVRAPMSNKVEPISIVPSTIMGNVTSPDGLINREEITVLTRSMASNDTLSVTLDFGQNIVGQLYIQFAGSQNYSNTYPGLKVAFSETLEFLGNRSDFTRSDNAAGVSLFYRCIAFHLQQQL